MNPRRLRITLSVFAFSIVFSSQVLADAIYSKADGTWSKVEPNGLGCGCAPNQNDDIFVSHDISIAGPFTVNTGSLTVDSGVTLTITGGPLSGHLTFNVNSNVTIDGSLRVTGNFENKNNSRNIDFNGFVRVDGSFSNGNGAIIDFGTGATISIGGGCTNNGRVTQGGMNFDNSCAGPLPVTLIFFNASQLETAVQLRWATASEQNFQHFVIERADEQLIWEEIGKVNGGGDTQTRTDYDFTDAQPGIIGNIYYRLKAVDYDGYFEYFPVAMVNYQAPKAWYVAPNPASNGEIVLMRNFSDDELIWATLCSMSGEEILSEQVSMVTNRHVFTTSMVNPGLYILKLREHNGVRHLRVVVE